MYIHAHKWHIVSSIFHPTQTAPQCVYWCASSDNQAYISHLPFLSRFLCVQTQFLRKLNMQKEINQEKGQIFLFSIVSVFDPSNILTNRQNCHGLKLHHITKVITKWSWWWWWSHENENFCIANANKMNTDEQVGFWLWKDIFLKEFLHRLCGYGCTIKKRTKMKSWSIVGSWQQ